VFVSVLLAYRAVVWAMKRKPRTVVRRPEAAISPGALRDNS
jgi:hypothetical protein